MPKLPSVGFNPVGRGVGVLARAFRSGGEGASGTVLVANRTREIRPSGMTRGACGNVARGAGLRPITKVLDKPPDPKVHAPWIYPNLISCGSSTGAAFSVIVAKRRAVDQERIEGRQAVWRCWGYSREKAQGRQARGLARWVGAN